MTDETPAAPSLVSLDQGGTISQVSTAQLADHRASWIAAGLDAAAFDKALQHEGVTLPPAADPKVIDHHAQYGLPASAQPGDYKLNWGAVAKDWPIETLAGVDTEAKQFAADMGFSPEVGAAVIERIASIGPSLAKQSDVERAIWIARQNEAGERMAGSPEKLAEALERARGVLRALAGESSDIAKGLLGKFSYLLHDPYLLMSLSTHSKMVEAFASGHPEDRHGQ